MVAPKWTKKTPTKKGWYWFYGYPDGVMGDTTESSKQLLLVEVKIIANKKTLIVPAGGSYFMFDALGKWMPATLPEVPDLSDVTTGLVFYDPKKVVL